MAHARPKNLNLLTIRFPLPAVVSILHRISGIALFFTIPILLWAFDVSLTQQGFDSIQMYFNTHILMKIFVWLVLIPWLFHLATGVRHLLMDIHIGETLKAGKSSAALTLIIAAIIILLAGIWVW